MYKLRYLTLFFKDHYLLYISSVWLCQGGPACRRPWYFAYTREDDRGGWHNNHISNRNNTGPMATITVAAACTNPTMAKTHTSETLRPIHDISPNSIPLVNSLCEQMKYLHVVASVIIYGKMLIDIYSSYIFVLFSTLL